jgi:hypothetical protein
MLNIAEYGAAPAFHPLARIPRFAIQGSRIQRMMAKWVGVGAFDEFGVV